MTLTGVFGGAFDPVHCGHLRTMVELREALALDRVLMVPNGTPPHRAAPVAPAAARVAMLEAALAQMPGCELDRRELDRDGPSYTIDTLLELRAQEPAPTLCLLIGYDAFCGLPAWHRWLELFELAHIAVAERPGAGARIPSALAVEVTARRSDPAGLRAARAGRVVFCETTQLAISSSDLRARAAAGRSLRWLVPDAVARLLEDNAWYGRTDD